MSARRRGRCHLSINRQPTTHANLSNEAEKEPQTRPPRRAGSGFFQIAQSHHGCRRRRPTFYALPPSLLYPPPLRRHGRPILAALFSHSRVQASTKSAFYRHGTFFSVVTSKSFASKDGGVSDDGVGEAEQWQGERNNDEINSGRGKGSGFNDGSTHNTTFNETPGRVFLTRGASDGGIRVAQSFFFPVLE